MNQDLTKGTPGGVLWRFCLPLFFGALVQQLYVVTDSLVAGRLIGETALAAVGNTYQITLLYQALAFGAAMGASVVVSQLFGAGRQKDVRGAVSTALVATGALCALLTTLGLACGDAMLRLMQTPKDAFLLSHQYMVLYTAGLLPLFLFQVALGIFAALGDAKTSALFLSFTSLANVALDLLFVAYFRLGVAGIACATLLCQLGGAILSLLILKRRFRKLRSIDHTEKSACFSPMYLRQMAQIALPVTLQQFMISLGNVLIQANVNRFGLDVSAGYAAAVKLNNMAISGLMAFDKGMSSFGAQNLGAKKPDRIRSGRNAAILFSVCFGVAISALYLFFRADLLRLFLRTGGAEAMRAGEQFFCLVMPFYLLVSLKIACDGTLRGLGAMRPLLIGTFVDLFLRVTCGYLFCARWGSAGIWAAWPVGWGIGTVLSIIFSKRAVRKLEADDDRANAEVS